jgi:hypothetical protein
MAPTRFEQLDNLTELVTKPVRIHVKAPESREIRELNSIRKLPKFPS